MNAKKTTLPHSGLELLAVLRRMGGSARNAQIAQAMGVSEETVRRLVKELAKSDMVERVHGGTFLRGGEDMPVYAGNLGQHPKEKSRIARAVADLVSDGMTIFVNVGSTTTFVAERLRIRQKLMIVTNSVSAAQVLAGHNGNKVFLAGGEVQLSERGAFGSATEGYARQFTYDMAILGVDALSAEHGFTLQNPAEADLSRVVCGQAVDVVIAADASKFGLRAPVVACASGEVRTLVTDAAPPRKLTQALSDWGVGLRVAPRRDDTP